ncbi:anti-sigma B factor antagonist [Actinomadura coerulea]|uniref:Anti-sigma factor antagonist n=1 Tax=Actinomadura coerulea TaxID=46159 RepID=A0A7X0G2I3_9ACTN|nr:STAS domain-containing protein [Actinomadura coerulea]MBB6398202.1 anti-sigma B factor antagonist [Actinomadura coerulea]GGQ35656.1 anti-sigma factor antagonist [Actinomadura coerulea]
MHTAGSAFPEAVLRRETLADHTVITISGDLDISSAPALREPLETALRDAGPLVVIDLSGVTFCDAAGLTLLTGARRLTEPEGVTLVLAAPRPHMVRLLRVSGLSRVFAVRPTVDAARLRSAAA